MADQPPSPLTHYDYRDDEISLYDLWNTLVKHRWLIGLVFIIALIGASVFALSRTPVYEMDLVLEIGEGPRLGAGGISTIESPGEVVSRLNEVVIPRIMIRQQAENLGVNLEGVDSDGSAASPTPEAEAVEGGAALIRLFGTASQSSADSLEQTMAQVVDAIIDDHDEILQRRAAQLDRRITEAREDLDRTTETTDALTGAMNQAREANNVETGREAEVLNRQLAATLSSIVGAIISKDTSQDIADIRSAILRLEELSDAARPTQVVRSAELSDEPEGQSAMTLIALGGVLGLMLGVFAAFGREFLANAAAENMTE